MAEIRYRLTPNDQVTDEERQMLLDAQEKQDKSAC